MPPVDEGTVSALLRPFVRCIPLLRHGRVVHPAAPLHLPDSEFLNVRGGCTIRILHLQPGEVAGFERGASRRQRQSVRSSLSEEYWFTRWSQPLQAGGRCSCSFRRSQRYSMMAAVVAQAPEPPPTRITGVETFVERLLQATLLEAYQEVCVANAAQVIGWDRSPPQAYDNFAFVPPSDDVDSAAVVKRRPKAANKHPVGTAACKHNQVEIKKPFAFLLHGIGSSADVWWGVIASLRARGHEIAAPDMLGHGYSSAPNRRSAYKFANLLAHALAAFDRYALQDEARKFVVIGHSFGCSLATAIARYRPSQVVQLVLISGGGPTALSPPEIGSEISVFSHLQLLISPLLFCGMKRSLFYSTRGKHFQRCGTDNSIPKYVLEYIDREQHWPEGDAAFHRRILIPTLLVHGLKDTNVTLVQECEMERTIPRAFLELIPAAGHMSLLETPEQLSHMILCFVDWWAR